ncbi:MAG: hypothetical protein ABI670_20505 [Chloroflexota bacterium]
MSATYANGTPSRRRGELLRSLLALLLVAVPLLLGQQTTASVVQDLGATRELPNITGLELPENGENGAFRWGDEIVTMQLQPLGYPLYAVLAVQGVRAPDLPEAQVDATSAGKDLGTQIIARSPVTLEYRLPAAATFQINPQITLTSTLFQPPGDRRQLGIVFYRLEHRNGPGPSVPSPWPATALLLSGLLVYCASRRAGIRPRFALAVTAIWGVLIGLLNALERPWLVFYSWYFVVPPLLVLLLYPWLSGMWMRRKNPYPSAAEDVGQPAITSNPWPVAIAVTVASCLTMLWHLVAPPEPPGFNPTHNVSWGVSFYQALPWPLQLLGVAVVIAAIAWAYFAPLRPAGEDPLQLPGREILPHWTPWALAFGGMALFALFPVAYSEGDSSEFDTKIPKGAIWRERELLDFYIKVRLWRLLQTIFRLPSEIYALVAVVAGGVYMAGTALVGRTLGRNRSEALFIIGALAAIGNILVFFRYVESYALVTVASLFVLWACWRYTEGRMSFGTLGALATLAPLFHGSALWWGPMVAVAWLVRAYRQPRDNRWRHALTDLREGVGAGAAIALLVVSIMLIDAYDYERFVEGLSEMGGADGRTMMPLFQTTNHYEHYAFFSLPHLGAVVQEQLLVAPLALLTIVIVAAASWRGVRRLARAVPAIITLAAGAAGMFFYSISWNPDLGPRDDWDLLALSALPLTLLAAFLLLHLPQGRPRRIALAAYLGTSAVHAAAWVLLHVLGIRY